MRISAIVWIVCVLAAMGLLAWVGAPVVANRSAGLSSGTALIGGPFTLIDKDGKTVTDTDFRGRYMLVYFGFTHCPDICPTGLLLIGNALEQLGSKGQQIAPVFITLDPERDTPAIMGQYVSHFSERLIGLSGSPEQVRQVAEAYKVYYRKTDATPGADYMIDHSGYMYLMGPDGTYLTHFPHQISESALKDGLAKFVR